MDTKSIGSGVLIRLDKEESLVASLVSLAVKKEWKSGQITGIGALKNVELGVYHLDRQTYDKKVFPEIVELLSLQGNLSLVEDKPLFHLHAICGDENFNCRGGHLFEAKVAITCEILFTPGETSVIRTRNEKMGLNLLDFSK